MLEPTPLPSFDCKLTDVDANCPTSTTSSTTTSVVDVLCSSTRTCVPDTDTATDTVMEEIISNHSTINRKVSSCDLCLAS